MTDEQWEDEDLGRRQAEADAANRDLEIEGHCIAAVSAEREAIVRYLRKQAQLYPQDIVCNSLLEVSDEIMRGGHATLHEAHGPSSNPPDSEARADSCERKGGTDSPDTSG